MVIPVDSLRDFAHYWQGYNVLWAELRQEAWGAWCYCFWRYSPSQSFIIVTACQPSMYPLQLELQTGLMQSRAHAFWTHPLYNSESP